MIKDPNKAFRRALLNAHRLARHADNAAWLALDKARYMRAAANEMLKSWDDGPIKAALVAEMQSRCDLAAEAYRHALRNVCAMSRLAELLAAGESK